MSASSTTAGSRRSGVDAEVEQALGDIERLDAVRRSRVR
jgi:hypothetical protein